MPAERQDQNQIEPTANNGRAADQARQAAKGNRAEGGERPLTRIGSYTVIKQIGEGTTGIVFQGDQQEPVAQKVAVKVIKEGRDWRQIVARFEAERHALSRIDHPNIAKILGNGTQPSGQPYFVLELAEGLPLTRYCDEHQLSLPRRLEMFVCVCQAVHYAHQRGVIHGDLKPSNILVAVQDGEPAPKILDLGISKATGEDRSEKNPALDPAVLHAKPEYIAPEQADAAPDIDTRSDVYCLGVLLYELLTSTTPLRPDDLKDVSASEVLRLIREKETPPPSTRLNESKDRLASVAQRRQMKPRKLLDAVRGELDCVATKALRKDRASRYETVHDLARDIQRYLAGEALEACPPSRRQLWKWAKKAPRPFLTAAGALLLFLAAVGGAGLGIWEWRQARQARATAQDAQQKRKQAEEQEKKVKSKMRQTEQVAEIRKKERDSAQAAQKEAENSDRRTTDILQFLSKKLMSEGRPGAVSLANAFWAGTRSPEDALVRKNITLREAVDETESTVAKEFANQPLAEATVRELLGSAYLSLAEAAKAVEQYKRAFELRKAQQGVDSSDTANCRNRLAVAYRLANRADEAARLFQITPHSPMQAAALAAHGSALLSERKPAAAELKFRESLAIRKKTQPDDWKTFDTESLLGESLLEQDNYTEAEPRLLSGYEGLKQHEDQSPSRDKDRLAAALQRLVRLYESWGKQDKAARWRKEFEAAKEP